MRLKEEQKGLNISTKSFISAITVIFFLMVLTYSLTFLVPEGGLAFWKWALSPILVLGAEGNGSLIAVIVFLLVLFFSLFSDAIAFFVSLYKEIAFRFY